MPDRVLVFGALLLAVAPGLSCGDDADSASGFAAQYCDLIKPCCAMAKLKTDGKQCQFFFGAFGGEASYNKQAGETCLAEVRAAASKANFCQMVEDDEEMSACDQVFGSSGKKQPGEACTDSNECAPSSEGSVDCESAFGAGGAQVRKCQVVVKGKEGDKPCVGTRGEDGVTMGNINLDDVPPRGYLCRVADGLRCDTTTDTCVKLKAIGEACRGDEECVSTGHCESTQCAPRKAVGGVCTPSFNNEECVTGAWCSDATSMCAAQADNGGVCSDFEECKSSNCVNGKCEAGLEGIGLAFLCGAP